MRYRLEMLCRRVRPDLEVLNWAVTDLGGVEWAMTKLEACRAGEVVEQSMFWKDRLMKRCNVGS